MDWGTVPQWATAMIATSAGIIAIASISAQRDIARRRASLDFFLKTVLDPPFQQISAAYAASIGGMFEPETTPAQFAQSREAGESVVAYLNVLELIAVGIHTKVLDERVCFELWSDEIIARYAEVRTLIPVLRERAQRPFSFIDREELSGRWGMIRKKMTADGLRHPPLR